MMPWPPLDRSKGGPYQKERVIQISYEDAVKAGMELRRIVTTQSFQLCLETLRDQYQREFFNSAWGERDKREQAYQQMCALDDLVSTINSFVRIAEQEVFETEQPDDTVF